MNTKISSITICYLCSFVVLCFALIINCSNGSNPCIEEWRVKCNCCETELQKQHCLKWMDENQGTQQHLRYPPAEDLEACRKKITQFKCENEPPANLRIYCGNS